MPEAAEFVHAQRPPIRRSVTLMVWVVVLSVLLLVGFGQIRAQQGPVGIGSRAPEFTLSTFEGGQVSTADLKGQVIVINFWASWCKPCEQEALALEQAYRTYRGQGVAFLGVDYVDTEREALAYLERLGVSYPNGPDLGTRISQAFRTQGVPETFVIGPDGRVAAVQIGPYESLEAIVADIKLAQGK